MSHPTKAWRVRPALYKGPGQYVFSEPWRDIHEEDWWGEPDGTFFFRGAIRVPSSFSGMPVDLELISSTEMLVKVSGCLVNALDPNRSRVRLLKRAEGGERLSVEMEAYVRSAPDDGRVKAFGGHGCVQSWRSPRLVSYDPIVEQFLYDVELVTDVAFCSLVDVTIRSHLEKGIDEALRWVDRDTDDRDIFHQSLLRADETLKQRIQEISTVQHPGCLGLVGHSHLDVAYHWRIRQGIRKNARTCLVQLALMEDYPEMLYCHTQPYLYEELKAHYPKLFQRVREKVKQGRWELAGGLYVEPDCNIPSGESLIRQCLLGKQFFLDQFEVDVDTCWLPDVFGNSWIMPQILKRSGINYFVSNKMSTWNDTNRFPHTNFRWRGVDGTEIFACVPASHFISWLSPEQLLANWDGFQEKETVGESMNMFGFGDGGGGLTTEMLERARRIRGFPGLPRTRWVSGKQYLDEAFRSPERLEVWDDELYLEMHRGTFTTKGGLKRLNRRCEHAAREAEIWSSLASLDGDSYPMEEFTRAWKKVLVNQFHDILPGSHTTPVGKEAEESYEEALSEFEGLRQDALDRLAEKFDTQVQRGDPWVLFNAMGWERQGLARIQVEGAGPWCVLDGQGKELPFQEMPGSQGPELLVQSPWIPSMGASVIYVRGEGVRQNLEEMVVSEEKLENRFFRIRFDPHGEIRELLDKRLNRQVIPFREKGNVLQLFEDKPGIYEAWDIVQNFEDKSWDISQNDRMRVVEKGHLRAGVELKKTFFHSRLIQRIWIYASIPRIDFETWVDWKEHNKLLKVVFPVDILSRQATYDLSYGAISRPTHKNTSWDRAKFEVCGHQWADLSEGGYGVSLLNDCKYGHDIQGNRIRLSLLRGPIRPDPDSDQGEHTFTYSLYPHCGTWQDAATPRAAHELNSPIVSIRTSRHSGSLGGRHSWLEAHGEGVHVGALKRSEDDEDLVLRLVELNGGTSQATVSWSGKLGRVVECDLLERPENRIRSRKTDFSVQLNPFQIRTFRVKTS